MKLIRPFASLANSAIVVALLFVLQSLFVVTPLDDFAPRDGGTQANYSIASQHCGKQDGNQGPTQDHCNHSLCCVLCKSNSGCGNLRYLTTPFDEALEPIAIYGAAHFSLRATPDQLERGPPGWASAWSSRSPPRFS